MRLHTRRSANLYCESLQSVLRDSCYYHRANSLPGRLYLQCTLHWCSAGLCFDDADDAVPSSSPIPKIYIHIDSTFKLMSFDHITIRLPLFHCFSSLPSYISRLACSCLYNFLIRVAGAKPPILRCFNLRSNISS